MNNIDEIKEKYFEDNRLRLMRRKEKNKLLVLEIVMERVKKSGDVFSEQEINEVLKEIYDDYAMLRRYLIDYKFLERDLYGKEYKIVK